MTPTILFVDDEAPIRELLSLYFRKKAFEVVTASSRSEAQGLIKTRPFDLAIVDVNLAGENGLELLSLFKRERPQMPVIIFTGITGDEGIVQRALDQGADGFMSKSGSLGDLFMEVIKHLPAYSSGD